MLQNFRGKDAKDTETPSETIALSTSFINASNISRINTASTASTLLLSEDNFDNTIEKRK